MKKVLFIILKGTMFGQTKLETRLFEIYNYDLYENSDNCQNSIFDYLELENINLDIAQIKIFDAEPINPSNSGQAIIYFKEEYNNEQIKYQQALDLRFDLGIAIQKNSSGAMTVNNVSDNYKSCYWHGGGSSSVQYINLTIAVTAPFPEEDTGYIEEGFEYCINEGNNLVSYPCDNAIPIAEAIPSSETFLDAIIGEGVAASYLEGVGWIGSLSNLQSGDGYWFQANTNVCFQYECSE